MKKLCGFSTVWADWADLGRTKTAEQKLKYATFEASFFLCFHGQNIILKYPTVRTEKLHDMKLSIKNGNFFIKE